MAKINESGLLGMPFAMSAGSLILGSNELDFPPSTAVSTVVSSLAVCFAVPGTALVVYKGSCLPLSPVTGAVTCTPSAIVVVGYDVSSSKGC